MPSHHRALEKPQTINVHSAAFAQGHTIPREYSGLGKDRAPPLDWMVVPIKTRAYAIVVDDPDAPGGTFTHWTAWNLPRDVDHVESEAEACARGACEGRNDFGTVGYRGPKPPRGTHHYGFRVFALDEELPLEPGATPEELWDALGEHTLAWGETMGTFTREA